eukprot:CAMPEP_0184694678 /NCGR_PEP_ID=MMETSP0313-20130426/2546_1 /TAXON_ID=2792 /ORGANISM="Porphyridium aerugineum, Strain SAG 1380-2" /LENGTH=622 /DNA_ID=CAMNT_0027153005 /DNA_START=453 /DNA_END=2321 /DNA_ORIENTATION=+
METSASTSVSTSTIGILRTMDRQKAKSTILPALLNNMHLHQPTQIKLNKLVKSESWHGSDMSQCTWSSCDDYSSEESESSLSEFGTGSSSASCSKKVRSDSWRHTANNNNNTNNNNMKRKQRMAVMAFALADKELSASMVEVPANPPPVTNESGTKSGVLKEDTNRVNSEMSAISNDEHMTLDDDANALDDLFTPVQSQTCSPMTTQRSSFAEQIKAMQQQEEREKERLAKQQQEQQEQQRLRQAASPHGSDFDTPHLSRASTSLEFKTFFALTSSFRSADTLLMATSKKQRDFVDPSLEQINFPVWLEALFQPIDEPIIALFQKKTKGFAHVFSYLLTFVTAVEAGLPWATILFALGCDFCGRRFAWMLLTLSVVSQVPKRFVFRPRPWMVHRAKKIRADKTSAFPSRAAACSVMYPILILEMLEHGFGIYLSQTSWSLFVAGTMISTGFARINVGAHYPTDIVAGAFMGWFVWTLGIRMESIYLSVRSLAVSVLPLEIRVILAAFVSLTVTFVFIETFWAKCSFVFGLLFAALSFDFCFQPVIASNVSRALVNQAMLSVPSMQWILPALSIGKVVQIVVVGLLILAYGMVAHTRKGTAWQMAVFTQIYFASLIFMIFHRM